MSPQTSDKNQAARSTSSAQIIGGEIKRHRFGVAFTAVALVLVVVAAYYAFNRQPALTTLPTGSLLTSKDTILLADFENKTGEELFDGTLRQGLAVQLQQSPFLDLFPDARVQATLKLMNRQPGEHVTRAIGREICQRQGLKALIMGSIAKFDRNYSITLEALNSQTGDWLKLTQVEAEGRDQVLKALSRAATELRGKLGESLSSIQKFDAQFERTTSSLEALREYSLGRAEVGKAQFRQAIEHQRRAVEIDPNFASAWIALATMYNNTKEQGLAAECAAKAFALRDRVSEYEKARITVFYYLYVTGELEQVIEAQQAFIQNYPRDYTGPGNLADFYRRTGQFEQAVAAAREALRLNPNSVNLHKNLAEFLLNFNRFAEAKEVCGRALNLNLDNAQIRGLLFTLAFISGDTAAQQEQLTWASGKADEYQAVYWQAQQAACSGVWRKSQELTRRATALAIRHAAPEAGAQYMVEAALQAAARGQGAQAAGLANAALKLARNKNVLTRAALALALADLTLQAPPLVRELERQYPKDTLVNQLWLPTIKAALAFRQGNLQAAIELLATAQRYEPAGEFWPQTVRAQAYLKLNRGAQAAAAYQQILDQRGQAPLSALYSLATLGLARAAALQGDAAKSRQAYQDFLTMWKEADADLPALVEAQRESAQR